MELIEKQNRNEAQTSNLEGNEQGEKQQHEEPERRTVFWSETNKIENKPAVISIDEGAVSVCWSCDWDDVISWKQKMNVGAM